MDHSKQHLNRGKNTMFHGSIPALVTPFKNGAVDKKAFAELVERQIAGGSAGLVPVGTTGETSTLSTEEHKAVVSLCVEVAAGRVPVIAGAGSNSTDEAIDFVGHAKAAGADAALVVCPYYNNPNQDGLYAHFKAINDAVAMPVILYNVPGRTIVDLQPSTVARLARLPNVVGIKDATGDMERVSQHAAQIGEGEQFVQLSGDDPSALGHLAMGGAGCISVTANVMPEACAAMHKAFNAGDFETAQTIERRLIALHKSMFCSPSPGPAKYVLHRLGLCEPDVRLPLTPPDAAAREQIDAAMALAGLHA
ncbi:dihydrodipicolinate synthase [Hyphomonas sp. CY54-11-8]|jgi:4-hydroxy-tetrahydrodipicolinate synthase|nr:MULTISPECIES: 4-hydroxy-tetrahydrodipicolinate synthase [unclassified Hyphomonas]KCZ47658.1 dihydrodipicolinate synthase [Hyphomonas sp. CY54-11-8]RAN39547.1 dihydrodipicolinate synthase [Hyphomonas sp. GM-8P]